MKNDKEIKEKVKKAYSKVAKEGSSCCPSSTCCFGTDQAKETSKRIGYDEKDINSVPSGSNLGLGCGNPVSFSLLKEGEVVLDLGCGAGFDTFLAAKKVGKKGKVIGVDMTEEMIKRAKENAKKGGYENVEFKLAEIENLPFPDNFFDLIISNCVINLSPNKEKVFKEAWRVLKNNGRMVISDIVLLKELPEFIKSSDALYTGCIAGAYLKNDYLKAIKNANFKEIKIISENKFPLDCFVSLPDLKKVKDIEEIILSLTLLAVK